MVRGDTFRQRFSSVLGTTARSEDAAAAARGRPCRVEYGIDVLSADSARRLSLRAYLEPLRRNESPAMGAWRGVAHSFHFPATRHRYFVARA